MPRVLACVIVLFGAVALGHTEGPATLDSFYIVRHHFSDAISMHGSSGFMEILEVVSIDRGARTRLIRFSSSDPLCHGMFVEAAERVVPGASVTSIGGFDLCTIKAKNAASNLARSRNGNLAYAGEADTLVMTCEGQERVIEFPDALTLDSQNLRSRDAALARAVGIFTRVRERVFGSHDPFQDYGKRPTPEQQAVAAAVIADLTAGRFKQPYVPDFRDYVTDGPSYLLPITGELIKPDALRLDSYKPVPIPAIAETAGVFGDVHLRLTVVPDTGVVTDVAAVSGAPLLAPAVVAAARTWRVVPGTTPSDRVDVTLRFQPHCSKE